MKCRVFRSNFAMSELLKAVHDIHIIKIILTYFLVSYAEFAGYVSLIKVVYLLLPKGTGCFCEHTVATIN